MDYFILYNTNEINTKATAEYIKSKKSKTVSLVCIGLAAKEETKRTPFAQNI